MRPSQKQNRQRGRGRGNKPTGNIVNRVFESAGPEGKVRGTPQQIIDKYLALARDAQTSGDRVASENFLQHAEHYQRMLIAAQGPQQLERNLQDEVDTDPEMVEEAEAETEVRAANQGNGQTQPSNGQDTAPSRNARSGGGLETIEPEDSAVSALVETPESSSPPVVTAPAESAPSEGQPAPAPNGSGNGAERPRRRRRPRAAEQPAEAAETRKEEAKSGDENGQGDDPKETRLQAD